MLISLPQCFYCCARCRESLYLAWEKKSEKVWNYFLWKKPWLTKVDLRKKCNAQSRLWKKVLRQMIPIFGSIIIYFAPSCFVTQFHCYWISSSWRRKVTVVELSTRLSLNHGIISPLRLTTLKKSMETARTKLASTVVLADDWRCDSWTSSCCIWSSG